MTGTPKAHRMFFYGEPGIEPVIPGLQAIGLSPAPGRLLLIGSISDSQGRETHDLLRHIFYTKGAAILKIIPICSKFLCFFLHNTNIVKIFMSKPTDQVIEIFFFCDHMLLIYPFLLQHSFKLGHCVSCQNSLFVI